MHKIPVYRWLVYKCPTCELIVFADRLSEQKKETVEYQDYYRERHERERAYLGRPEQIPAPEREVRNRVFDARADVRAW